MNQTNNNNKITTTWNYLFGYQLQLQSDDSLLSLEKTKIG